MKNVALSKQSLITPMPLHLTSQLEYVALQHMPWIQRNGFELRPIDPASSSQEGLYRLELTQVPQLKNMTLGSNDLEELLQKLSNGQSEPRCDRVRAWYASKACRTSVMIGMALTRTKMKTVELLFVGYCQLIVLTRADRVSLIGIRTSLELPAWSPNNASFVYLRLSFAIVVLNVYLHAK